MSKTKLKCIQTNFIPENYAQIMTYLKATGLRLGLLINFGLHKAYSKRIIFDKKRNEDREQWDKSYFQNPAARNIVDSVIESVRCVDKELGVAYHNKVYQAAVAVDFGRKSIAYNDKVYIKGTSDSIQFNPFEIDYWLIQDLLLLGILAGNDKPRAYDLFRMRSYLRSLGLNHGLIVYWSNRNVQLYGIYEA